MREDEVYEWFTQAIGSAGLAEQLTACCQRLEVRQNDIIASQGDPADCMHFILASNPRTARCTRPCSAMWSQ